MKDNGPEYLTPMRKLAPNNALLTNGGECRRCAGFRMPAAAATWLRNLSVPRHVSRLMPSSKNPDAMALPQSVGDPLFLSPLQL